ncbi:acyl carrier protein [Streptomyces microflavus]|uniref:acyl carrier protein n=1 Tax=Streptomyces microflavus TaxID=1919 RepID=UPI0034196159
MTPVWILAVAATATAIGAVVAAGIAAKAVGKQTSSQSTSQQDQWRRTVRRETYGALLTATAEARDELGTIFIALRAQKGAPDVERLAGRLEDAKSLVHSARRATALVFVEGPPAMLEPTKRIEEGIILFHTALTAVIVRQPGPLDEITDAHFATCGKQRVAIRQALLDFATAARCVLDDEEVPPTAAPAAVPTSVEELTWLLDAVSIILGDDSVRRSRVLSDGSLWDHGFDSLSAIELAQVIQSEHGLRIDATWVMEMGSLPLHQIAGHMAVLRKASS